MEHTDLMAPSLFNGDLQTMYAAGSFDNINQIYYGRRLIYWDDGSLVSVDYPIERPNQQCRMERADHVLAPRQPAPLPP